MPFRSKKARLLAKSKPAGFETKLPTPPLPSRSESGESDDLLLSSESSFDASDQLVDFNNSDVDVDSSKVAVAFEDPAETGDSQGQTATAISQDLDLSPIDGSGIDCLGAANDSCDDLANVMEVEQEAIAVEESFIMSKQGDEEGEPTGPTPFKAKSLNVMFEGVAEEEIIPLPVPAPDSALVASSTSTSLSINHNRSNSIQVFLRIRPMADTSKVSTIKVLPNSSSSSAPSTVRTIPPPGSFSEKQRTSSEGIAGESEGSELQTLKEVRHAERRSYIYFF
jgi:hypothetical protein